MPVESKVEDLQLVPLRVRDAHHFSPAAGYGMEG